MLGVNQVKLDKKSVNGLVHIDFHGNLDSMVEKMKRIEFMELEDRERLQLKCCFLFICGFSFVKIAERLNISTGSVSRLLNDEKLESMLSFEYRVLFQKNRSRLFSYKEVSDKIKQAVFTFVAQDGNYQNTCKFTHVSERTLSRYFSNPQLESILNDPVLYMKFLEVRDCSTSQLRSKAASIRYSNQSIKNALMELKPSGVVQKKYLMLAEAILVQHVQDMNTLKKLTGMTQKSIETYLTDFSRCENFFTPELLVLFKNESSKIYFANDLGISSEEYERMIIQFYMSGRYPYPQIESMFGLGSNRLQHILGERAAVLLSEEDYRQLRDHIDFVKSLCVGNARKKRLIQSQKMIEIVKPEFIFVSDFDHHLLSMLVDFLTAYESLQYDTSMASVIKVLLASDEALERLLTEEAFSQIKTSLSIERLLLGNSLKEKYQYISSVVKEFLNCDLDLEKTSEVLGISIPSLIRVLQAPYVSIYYGPIVSEYIKQSILNYKSEFAEIQNKDKRYKAYTYMSVPETRFEKK